MSVQEFTNVINPGAIGKTVQTPIVRPIVIGVFSGLPSGSIGKIGTANASNVKNLGIGRGAETVALCLNLGHQSVDYYPCYPSAGSSGSYSPYSGSFTNGGNLNGTATGSVVPNLTGTPNDDYLLRVEILQGAASNAAVTFRYSLDDSNSFMKTVTALTGGLAPLYSANPYSSTPTASGLSVSFPSGTWVAGDVFNSQARCAFPLTSTVSAPLSGTVEGGLSALSSSYTRYTHAYIAGETGGSTDSANAAAFATIVSNATSIATSLDAAGYPLEVFIESPRKANLGDELDTTYQALVTGSIATTYDQNGHVAVGYGHTFRNAQLGAHGVWRSTALTALERTVKNNDPSVSLYTSDPVTVITPTGAANSSFTQLNYAYILGEGSSYDENRSVNSAGGSAGAASAAGFLSLYRPSFASSPGSWTFLAGNTHADPQSDFQELVWATQFNALRTVISKWLWRFYKGQNLQTNKTGPYAGCLSEVQASAIESAIQRKVETELVANGYIPAAPSDKNNQVDPNVPITFITIDRTNVIAQSSELRYQYRMWVDAYVKTFRGEGSLAL